MLGVHPAGIIGIATASKFTRGLEQELRWIAQNATDADLDASALSTVFSSLRQPQSEKGTAKEGAASAEIHGVFIPSDRPLNREQILAVRDALTQSVSLVIGPPGTGTSTDGAKLVEVGKQLWRKGDFERGIPACAGCHGPAGAGLPSQYPRLAGQYAEYTVQQLKNFRAEERSNDPERMMRTIADKMSDRQIKAVADYIAGLR